MNQETFAVSDSSKSLITKKKLQEDEEETEALSKMAGGKQEESTGGSDTKSEKEEVDARSIYVGNVDYFCTPEEVQQHFDSCGTINRVTILIDSYGHPKGFAYVEFAETDSVQNALLLNESELHGRKIKVSAKRTNVPGMGRFRGGCPTPHFGFRYPAYSPYGQFQRAGRHMRYRPY